MKATLNRLDQWLWQLDRAFMTVAGLFVIIMMLVTFVDVFMRYALNAPLTWAYDLIIQYLLIGSFYFAFSYALRMNHNVVVDFFSNRLPSRLYYLLMGIGHAAVTAIFALIVWVTAQDTYISWVNEEAYFGAFIWPVWSSKIIIPIGALALTLRMAHRSLVFFAGINDEGFMAAMGLKHRHEFTPEEQL